METIKLDLIPGKKMPSLHASQYDDGREHGIDLFENGVVYKLDGTETLTINERKGDDCICSLDIVNTFAESNHIVFASTEQMCAVWGNNLCELVIKRGSVTLGTLNFILEIESSPTEGGIESESEIKNLKRQIEEITEQVIGDDYYTAEETDEAIATAIEGKADTTYVDTELGKKADKSNTYTKSEVDTLIDNLPEPMIFKGTLGVGGTIQSLPTASASNEGYTYKVIADGTYAEQTAKVGDVFTSNGSEWVLIPSGDEDTDTWRNIKVNGVEKLGNGISSGAVDFEDTANVKFEFDANGNKVRAKLDGIYTDSEVDELLEDKADADNTYTKAQVDDIVYNILPDDTASGPIANFKTSLELPIKSLGIDVNAMQSAGTPTPAAPLSISGWSEISLDHTGENLWNEVWEVGAIDNNTGLNKSDGTNIRSVDYIDVKPNTAYFFYIGSNVNLRIYWYDKNKTFISSFAYQNQAVTSPNNAFYLRIRSTSSYGNTYKNDISVNYPSTDTAYHAHNPNSFTTLINLGGTYYGGHFTQDKDGKREITVTKGITRLGDLTNWRYAQGSGVWRFQAKMPNDYKLPETISERLDFISSCFTPDLSPTTGGSVDNSITGYTNDTKVYILCNSYTDLETFLTDLSSQTLVYTLAEPFTVALPDGEPIKSFAGINNIYADTGDCAVEFKVSVEQYVSSHSGGALGSSLRGGLLGSNPNTDESESESEGDE